MLLSEIPNLPPAPPPPDDPLVAAVRRLPYWACRRFFWHRLPGQYPRFLYKYRNLRGLTPQQAGYLRQIIVESQLYLSSPHELNDPNEMRADIYLSTTDRWRIYERMKGVVARARSDLPRGARREIAWNMSAIAPGQLLESGRMIYEKNRASTGIHSFARTARSSQMWTYYAGEHSGCCLQFEVARDPGTLVDALPLEYDDAFPRIDWTAAPDEQMRDVLLRKAKRWEHEEESRIIRPGYAGTHLNMLPGALVGVIEGLRMAASERAVLRSMLDERQAAGLPPVSRYAVRNDERGYHLLILRADA